MKWAERFIGIPYEPAPGHDCLWLVHHVLTEQFGLSKLPPYSQNHMAWLDEAREVKSYAVPAIDVADGFIAVFNPDSRVEHVGLIVMGHEPYVLHAHQQFGASVLQPLRVAKRWLKLDSIYNPFE